MEDLITYADLLFSEVTEPQAPSLLPPGSGLSRTGVISYHPIQDGPQPGSSRTRVQIVNADTTALPISPVEVAARNMDTSHRGEGGATIVVDPPMASPEETTDPKRPFAQDGQLELLFDPGLIPASMRDGLLEDYHVRHIVIQ